jgi:hypothetical protein
VTVAGNADGGSPTGTVTFSICGPLGGASGCASGGRQLGGPVRLTARAGNTANATSAAFTPTKTGTWCFRADYSGDANYTAAADGRAAECFTVPVPGNPSITVTSPRNGATYRFRQSVPVSYSCADSAGAPGIASCAGTLANGSPLDTSKPGQFSFTVTATSKDGQTTTITTHYTVRSSTTYRSTGVKGHRNGHVTLRVGTSGPGVLNVLVTNWVDNLAQTANVKLLQPARRRFVWGRAHLVVGRAGTYTLDVAPNRHARRVLAHHRYTITLRVWVTFSAPGERQRKIGYRGIQLPR